MPAFRNPHEPVALPGEAIRLDPAGDVRLVRAFEQMARVGPVDYGSANASANASESGSNIIDWEDELEMADNHLGQFLVNPLSQVEVTVKETGQQDQRFVNKNQVGVITPFDPPQQRLVWVFQSDGIQAEIFNPQTWNMAKTLVYFTGYKFILSEPLDQAQVDRLPGSPAAVPVDTLKQPGGT